VLWFKSRGADRAFLSCHTNRQGKQGTSVSIRTASTGSGTACAPSGAASSEEAISTRGFLASTGAICATRELLGRFPRSRPCALPVTSKVAPALPQANYASGLLIGLGLLTFGVVWLSLLAYASLAPPVDNIEQLTWVRSLEWGYYKHPPLPTFLLWLPTKLLGLSAGTSYLVGATVTLTAVGLLWRLLVPLRGRTYATLALLAALCITFYNGRLYYYNHNVVLMLMVVASAACCWRAFDQRRLVWWVCTGIVLGLGALTKYQIAVTATSLACFWVSQRAWRDPVHVRGLGLAALSALLIFLPHLLWLRDHAFGPIHYAIESSLGASLGASERLWNAVHWEADALLNRALPAVVFLLACGYAVHRRSNASPRPNVCTTPTNADPAKALILCWGLVPLIFMPLVGITFGSDLQLQWGTPFLAFVAPSLMELKAAAFWNRVHLPFALKLFVPIQVLLLLINYLTSPLGVQAFKDTHWRNFPSERLAKQVAEPARGRLGRPVSIVVGPPEESGALALLLPEHPLILIDGRYEWCPWVPRKLLADCGGVQIIRAPKPPRGYSALGPRFPGLHWRVIEPTSAARTCPVQAPQRIADAPVRNPPTLAQGIE
jgi:4-amino-4-deoxy-L-arabinose transferase-like glycosyltransferase